MLRKKNFLVVTILLLLVFLVTGCSGFLPKPTKGVISGRVLIPPTAKQLSKDISGWVGAAGAEVTIVDANGVKHTVITDENGYYNFENIAVKPNTVVTATVKVDGKTMVLKTVVDKAVGKDQKYDSGAMTPESTALALVVEQLIAEGAPVDLDEIRATGSYADLLGRVAEILEGHGNIGDDPDIYVLLENTVYDILYPDDSTPAPPSGDGDGTPTPKVIKGLAVEARTAGQLDLGTLAGDEGEYTLSPKVLVHIADYLNGINETGKWVGLQLKPTDVTDITELEYRTAKSSGFQALTTYDVTEAGAAGEIVWWPNAGIADEQWIELRYAGEGNPAIKLTVTFELYGKAIAGLAVEARTAGQLDLGTLAGDEGEYTLSPKVLVHIADYLNGIN
ncbi:MAG: carboxypeptidase-like regulatory domain-containing protein, partial [Bacteroidales bacterium]|nr:carboxypeptidase-like regulatory domain-containing protein [Bacteroidales bacterium]